jgi:hypothetical protein
MPKEISKKKNGLLGRWGYLAIPSRFGPCTGEHLVFDGKCEFGGRVAQWTAAILWVTIGVLERR